MKIPDFKTWTERGQNVDTAIPISGTNSATFSTTPPDFSIKPATSVGHAVVTQENPHFFSRAVALFSGSVPIAGTHVLNDEGG